MTVLTILLAACVLLPAAGWADDAPPLPVVTVTDALYKGVVGKALDAVPMDPEHRATLQRTNAIISSASMGRTLTVWVGLTNPILMIGGIIWGIFSATNIKAKEVARPSATTVVEPAVPVELAQAAGGERLAVVDQER